MRHAKITQAGHIQYGNWGSTIGASGKLLLLAASGGGLKVARVDPDDATDLTKVSPFVSGLSRLSNMILVVRILYGPHQSNLVNHSSPQQ